MQPGETQYFIRDIEQAIANPVEEWQAPSWPLFLHACTEQRPVAIITARGHSCETIKAGIDLLVGKFLPTGPNYLAIYAVNNPQTSQKLLSELSPVEQQQLEAMSDRTSALKRIAIHNCVEAGLAHYGSEPAHRFGMSDDDPQNIDLIVKAMCDCKKKYLDKRFFAIDTHKDEMVKLEVFPVDYPVTSVENVDKYVS